MKKKFKKKQIVKFEKKLFKIKMQKSNENLSSSIQIFNKNIENSFQLLQKCKKCKEKKEKFLIEKDLRDMLQNINREYKSLNGKLKGLENMPNKSGLTITTKELERLRNQLNHSYNSIQSLEEQMRNLTPPEQAPEKQDFQNSKGTADDMKKTNKQLYEEHKEDLAEQEHDIDNLLGCVTNIKNAGMNINDELDEEAGLLKEITSTVENNTKKLLLNNKKLEGLLAKVSNQCLICVIIAEILIILVLFLIF